MRLQLLLVGLATSSLVLTGVRSPSDAEPRHHMLRDSGDLWSPADPGSNVIPCGDYGAMAERMDVPLGEPFTVVGSLPATAGGGELSVHGIFDSKPNFNLAGVLYPSQRFNSQDIGENPTNFSLEVTLPHDSAPGPVSLQVSFVGRTGRHPYFQCLDLNGTPAKTSLLDAMGWWLVGLGAAALLLFVCCVAFWSRKCCCRPQEKTLPIIPASVSKSLGPSGTKPTPVHMLPEVSFKDSRDADSDRDDGPSYVRSDVEIERMSGEFEDEPYHEPEEEDHEQSSR